MRYLLQISSLALTGREADYNRWYEERHIQMFWPSRVSSLVIDLSVVRQIHLTL